MKKIIAVLFAVTVGSVWAYNPPPGGESYPLLGHPALILNAGSVAGGGIFNAGPWSAGLNPALIAGIQRVSADVAYTGLLGKENHLGSVINLALLFPGRWGVFSIAGTTLLSPPENMDLGSTLAFRASFSKDISEKFYVGASVFTGFSYKFNDFAAALDLGAFFRLGSLGFLKDARLGITLANLGKPFKSDVWDITGGEADFVYGFITPKVGFAASLVDAKAFKLGFSTDLAAPAAQNALWSIGAQALIANFLTISGGWDINLREILAANENDAIANFIHSPYIGISVKIAMNIGGKFMESRGWQQSDLEISGAGQKLHDDVWLFSAGATANFGLRDTTPPVIELWAGEED
ncbi:MAG: hypothetical protein LBR16_03950 [Treponema sp.]|jgi:hypothetical protein|nr:hypothetical protein [Treponema sp.]